ncbi:MAG: DEAD/DEAH box helicase [Kiritimatiellae bacterium]|nr:DEAD/DEAH box helicase [Kiritimatiellia bacterium]MDD5520984.1 DEAD/DEAH box helicase [Kiritimatiellia bacterium]
MKWTELRPIQVDAIHEILEQNTNLIISAMTAGGKTEAAFLPVLSAIMETKDNGVQAIYIGPLKALINDQFRRLEDLCERAEITVHKWHGDVGQAAKKNLLKQPSGVLLITPESVESFFINRPKVIKDVFHNVLFIVIDEMHSFIGTERGAHLKSLISRLTQACDKLPRIIGLSATIGDNEMAKLWLCPRSPGNVHFIKGEGDKTIKYLIKGYPITKVTRTNMPQDETEDSEATETESDIALTADLIETFYGKTALIFANSRARLEFYTDLVGRQIERRNRPNLFRIHHGSLSKAEREETEEALRSGTPTATFCSSTLELGIDVGNVSAVGQIGPPWSVSSLIQRLGRSGRRSGEPAVLMMFIEDCTEGNPVHMVCPKILQAIAMTELLLRKWCEPPATEKMHLSTLIQQILSVITERGGASAETVYNMLIKDGAFTGVTHEFFPDILRGMGKADLIEQTPEGDLILGIFGENIVRDADFYSAFASSQEMKVFHKEHLIGTIDAPPGLGADGFIILAGRRWKITDIDEQRQEIFVEPAKGGRVPTFLSTGGTDIHPLVRYEMLNVLLSDKKLAYLDAAGQEILRSARAYAKRGDLSKRPFVKDGDDIYWFTWTGSRINRTLMALGKFIGGLEVRDEDIALCFSKADFETIKSIYTAFLKERPTADQIAEYFPIKIVEKYDTYLPEHLLTVNFARNSLDVTGAIDLISKSMS